MEKEEPKPRTFKLISTDEIEHTVSSANLALSKTLNEFVQDPFFDSSKSIPVDLNDRVLSLLISCMEKVSAIVPAEDQVAYNQKVVSALNPLFVKDSSEKNLIGGIVFLHDNWLEDICLLVKESNKLNISVLLDYLVNFIADYLQSSKDIDEISNHIKHIEGLPLDMKGLIKEQLMHKEENQKIFDKLIFATALVLKGHKCAIQSVAYSPDVKQALTGSHDETAKIWDITTGKMIKKLKGRTRGIYSLAYSPDGKQALTGSSDGTARILDITAGNMIKELKGHAGAIWSVVYSPDGKQALTGSLDGTARIWDIKTGQTIKELKGHTNGIYSLAYSPDGKQALTGSEDRTARIWDIKTGQTIKELKGHIDAIWSVAYSPDGKQALTGSWDKTARIWDIKTGAMINELIGHTSSICSVAYSPDGKQALTGSEDKTVRIWDVTTGEMIKELKNHTGAIRSVAYSPDGKQALTGSSDGTARVWDIFIIDRLSLPQVILLIKLEQLTIKVLEDNYLKQVFDTLPDKLKKNYQEQAQNKSVKQQNQTFIDRYKKSLAITAGISIATIGGYLLIRFMKASKD